MSILSIDRPKDEAVGNCTASLHTALEWSHGNPRSLLLGTMNLQMKNQCLTRGAVSGTRFLPYLILILVPMTSFAAPQTGTTKENANPFVELSLEELMNIEVTSVSGVAQSWFQSPAAIYVIDHTDIRRTGHQSLPELLRLVPGMYVGRINANQWAISARGFNSRFSNQLLVLIDGRSAYDSLFSGVFWEFQDSVLEDLDRIEVIRGPGATLWGANAVNGVINVTSKSAKDTQGWYFKNVLGNEERSITALRYGGQINKNVHYRLWAKYANRDEFEDTAGKDTSLDWDLGQGGFRMDIDGADRTTVTVDGRVYETSRLGQAVRSAIPPGPSTFTISQGDGYSNGGHILVRVRQDTSEDQSWTLQAYYDRFKLTNVDGVQVRRDTVDLDYRRRHVLDKQHDLQWGLGFRYWDDRTRSGLDTSFRPRSKTNGVTTAFIQDTLTLAADELFLMIGSKFEHNEFTGFEFQPSARLSWTPDDRHTFWGAISRSVRTPSRLDDGLNLTADFFFPAVLAGDPNAESEDLLAFEVGYRARLNNQISIDTTAFYFDYDDLLIVPPSNVGLLTNAGEAESYGAEIAVTWQATNHWHIIASYSYLDLQMHGPVSNASETETPEHQFQIRSYYDISKDLELNTTLYYADNVSGQGVPSFFRLDVGLTWRPSPNLELSVWGQNLLDGSHREFNETFRQPLPIEIQRSVYAQVTLRF